MLRDFVDESQAICSGALKVFKAWVHTSGLTVFLTGHVTLNGKTLVSALFCSFTLG